MKRNKIISGLKDAVRHAKGMDVEAKTYFFMTEAMVNDWEFVCRFRSEYPNIVMCVQRPIPIASPSPSRETS